MVIPPPDYYPEWSTRTRHELAVFDVTPGRVNLSVVDVMIRAIDATGPEAFRSIVGATEANRVKAMRSLLSRVVGSSNLDYEDGIDRWGAVTVANMIRSAAGDTAGIFMSAYKTVTFSERTTFVNSVTAAGVGFYLRGMADPNVDSGFGQEEYDDMTTPWRSVFGSLYCDDKAVPMHVVAEADIPVRVVREARPKPRSRKGATKQGDLFDSLERDYKPGASETNVESEPWLAC